MISAYPTAFLLRQSINSKSPACRAFLYLQTVKKRGNLRVVNLLRHEITNASPQHRQILLNYLPLLRPVIRTIVEQ